MNKIIYLLFFISILYAQESNIYISKLSYQGKQIADIMCRLEALPKADETIEKTINSIVISKACIHLSKRRLKAVAYFLTYGNRDIHLKHIVVPKDAKCPVCGMFVSKYPKWVAYMEYNSKKLYFDGVKDMMKYYIFDGDFIYNRKDITKIGVSDYYTLEEIDAKKAFYVLDSNIFGPMGHELIAFKSKKSAKAFMSEHHGKVIVQFDDITDKMLMELDGL